MGDVYDDMPEPTGHGRYSRSQGGPMSAPIPEPAAETGREPEDGTRLTEDEREALWDSIERAYLDTTTWDRDSEDEIERTVERIVAARVAEAEAQALEEAADDMYDEWPGGTGQDGLVVMWAEDWLRQRAERRRDGAS